MTSPNHPSQQLLKDAQSIDFFAVAKGLLAKIVIARSDGHVVFVNDRWVEYTGLNIGKSTGSLWQSAIDERDRSRVEGVWQHTLESGRIAEFELRLIEKSGDSRWHVCRINPIHDADGNIQQWCAFIADVHDQKMNHAGLEQHLGEASKDLHAAKEQLAREREFSQIGEAIPQIVWTAAPDGALDYHNRRWEDYTGMSGDETRKQGWSPVIHPDDRRKSESIWDQCLKSGEPYETEFRILRARDHTYRWHLGRALPIRNSDGEIIKWFGTCTDIHDQILAQEEAVELSLRLQKSESELRQLAEAVPEVVWTASIDGSIEYFNQRWYEFTGLSAEESIGWGWQKAVHPDEVGPHEKVWKNAIETGTCIQLEQRLRTRTGGYRWFLVRAVPFRDEEGNIVKWFGTLTDIEDQKHNSELLEQGVLERTNQLKKLAERHEEATMELQTLAYTISHELQAPLKTIISDLGLLAVRYKGRLGHDADEFIGNCVEAAHKTERMVDDLWIYARLDRPNTVIKAVDMNETFAKSLLALKEQQEKSNAAITCETLPTIKGNPDQLLYLLTQLTQNALTFNTSPQPSVHVAAVKKDNFWVFSVKDNGIGFDMVDAVHIFKMFVRLTNQYPGTGMGLAICKKIANVHGGSVWVESQPFQGSTFYFSLPSGEQSPQAPAKR